MKRVLRPIHLWAIAVGLVISGDYFGWNYGLQKGGPIGMAVATLLVTLMYVCFIFSYTELSTAIPHSGGPFAFARKAFGPMGGYVAGFATLIEFVFAPPAIARAIGAYVHFRVPTLGVNGVAVGAFFVFGLINALGVSIAATFELFVTALAAFELGLFFFLTGPHVEIARLVSEPFTAAGMFGAIPFAIWFYLGMEGVAMSAEEVVDPPRDIPKGYIAGIITLVVLALGTLTCTSGVLPWQELVQDDSPLPKALASVLSPDHPMTHLMVYLGLFGLIASFHGIIMGCSRQLFALGRDAYLPRILGRVHPRLETPVWAIVIGCSIGALAVLTERTDDLITLSVLGALCVYIVSMLSLFRLRKSEPLLVRPFRAPFYPVFPALALLLSVLALCAVIASQPTVSLGFFVCLGLGAAVFRGTAYRELAALVLLVFVACHDAASQPTSLPEPELVLLDRNVTGNTAVLSFELKNTRTTPLVLQRWESGKQGGALSKQIAAENSARLDIAVPLMRPLGRPAEKLTLRGRILASDELVFEFEDTLDAPPTRIPDVETEVTAQRFDTGKLDVFVVLNLHNPNAFALTFDSVSYVLRVEGEVMAQGEAMGKDTLRDNGKKRVEVPVAIEAGVLSRRRRLTYQLDGSMLVQGSRYPFKKVGEFRF